MSLPNPMFDAAQTGEIPRVTVPGGELSGPYAADVAAAWPAAEPDAFVWPETPRMPARLQTMMLPNGQWLLVLDNASEVDRLPSGLNREELCARTGASAVLVFGEPVEIVEAYPEPVIERDEQLIADIRTELDKLPGQRVA